MWGAIRRWWRLKMMWERYQYVSDCLGLEARKSDPVWERIEKDNEWRFRGEK